jgi:FtsP/CotA-like multicopper oxidase with cupredoxin domain
MRDAIPPPRAPDRRAVLTGAAAMVATGLAVARGARAQGHSGAPANRLTLTAVATRLRLRPGTDTETSAWRYAPDTPLRVRQGEPFTLDLRNDLTVATSLGIRGLRPSRSGEGLATAGIAAVAPGQTRSFALIAPDPGLHLIGPTAPDGAAEQMERGLSQVLIVDEPDPQPVDVDITLVIDDWRLAPDGRIEDSFADKASRLGPGRLGNVLTVNGAAQPAEIVAPAGGRVRCRIVSACNARIIPLKLEGAPCTLIGVGGLPASPFRPLHGEMTLPPAGRFEFVFDMPAEGEARLVARLGAGLPVAIVQSGGAPRREALPPVAALPRPDLPERIDLARARRATIEIAAGVDASDARALAAAPAEALWRLNGRAGTPDGPALFAARRGESVVLTFINRAGVTVAIGHEGHPARILHPRDDGWEPYWLDTVLVPPGGTERLAFVADVPGRWMIAGRILEHLAGGQFGWYEVA